MLLYRFTEKYFLKPPHRFLPCAGFVAVLVYFFLDPHSPIRTFSFADPDDYMRLNETINWIKWQGWFDLSHPRLAPGDHTIIHWARYLDVPLALLMRPFYGEWGLRNAATIAALIEPLVLLAFLFTLVPKLAQPLLGRGKSRLAVVFVPFIAPLLFNFSPGRVDHHNWEILFAGLSLLTLLKMVLAPGAWKVAPLGAIALVLGLWASPEIVPILLLTVGCLGLFGALGAPFIARNGAVFGFWLGVSACLALPAACGRQNWGEWTVSWFSPAYVLLCLLAGGSLILAWLLSRSVERRSLKLGIFGALGSVAVAGFLLFVPSAALGPFADYDTFNATVSLDNISEAQPLIRSLGTASGSFPVLVAGLIFFKVLFTESLCLCVCLFFSVRAERRRRVIWQILAVFLAGTMGLAVFCQYRVLWFTQLFQIIPMTYLVFHFWHRSGIQRFRVSPLNVSLAAFLLFAGVPHVAAMLTREGDPAKTCRLKPAAEWIAGPFGYWTHPYTILAGFDEGPELLFRTPHNVIGANFHVPANRDVYNFFTTASDVTALEILRRRKVDLVLTCRNLAPFYRGTRHPKFGKNAFLKMGADKMLHIGSDPRHPAFSERLVDGPLPPWLKPVEIPVSRDYLLFEVHLPPVEKSVQ